MPLPMVHLSVAMRLCALCGWAPSPSFLLGSLAPDAIHMREAASADDKRRVHFRAEEAAGDRAAVVTAVWAAVPPDDAAANEQAAGYLAHLFTDYPWTASLVRPEQARQAAAGAARDEIRALYYRETDQIDFDLYHQQPWRPQAWQLLAAARPVGMPGLLTAQEIGAWRDRTLHWFGETIQEPGITPTHYRPADVAAFIEDTAAGLARDADFWWPTARRCRSAEMC
jgi:hypothetical protein